MNSQIQSQQSPVPPPRWHPDPGLVCLLAVPVPPTPGSYVCQVLGWICPFTAGCRNAPQPTEGTLTSSWVQEGLEPSSVDGSLEFCCKGEQSWVLAGRRSSLVGCLAEVSG